MGFSVRLAPGVRIRASSRGVRASFGPRVARIHVGTGRTGFSTGIGPISAYTSLSGGRRRNGPRASLGSYQGQSVTAARRSAAAQRAVDKAAEAQRLADTFTELLTVHRARFTPAQPPIAPPGPSVDAAGVRERYRTAAVRGISCIRRRRRAQARLQADAAADWGLAAAAAAAREDRAARQAVLDQVWQLLEANDASVVMSVLEQAFADNEAAAAPVGLDGGEVSLVVVAPDESVVPERMPGITDAGNLSLRRLGKGARAG